MEEIWKPIAGYEGKYEASNLGRIRSFAQTNRQGNILSGYPNYKGYLQVYLYDSPQHGKWHSIHRLIAFTFIENPNDYPQVNHKDENKLNNAADNLEWCTNRYNSGYGTRAKRAGMSNRCCETTSKKIYSIDQNGHVEYFNSIGEAERQTGIAHSNIVRVLKDRRKTAGNRRWFYAEDNSQITNND